MSGFKVGDKTVYPSQGVSEVMGIESREVSGRKLDFYILRILASGSTVMVPKDNANLIGLRTVITPTEVKKVFSILRRRKVSTPKTTWNRRHREYLERLKTGSIFETAEVLRELSLLRRRKDLSYSERRVMETARSLIVKELAVARRTKESRIERELDAILG